MSWVVFQICFSYLLLFISLLFSPDLGRFLVMAMIARDHSAGLEVYGDGDLKYPGVEQDQ